MMSTTSFGSSGTYLNMQMKIRRVLYTLQVLLSCFRNY